MELRRRNRHLALAGALAAGTALTLSIAPARAACLLASADSWTGGAGTSSWANNSNWSAGAYPNSPTTNVCVISHAGLVAWPSLDVSATIRNLQLGENSSDDSRLFVSSPGHNLTVAGSQINLLGGHSEITVSTGAKIIFASDANITGNGFITLQGGGALDGGPGTTLNLVAGAITVRDLGSIGDSGMNFVVGPGGFFNAGGFAATVHVGAGGGSVVNNGTVRVRGVLDLTGDANGYVQDQVGGFAPLTTIDRNLIAPGGVFIQAGTLQNDNPFLDAFVTGDVTNAGDLFLSSIPFLRTALTITGDFTEQSAGLMTANYLINGPTTFAALTVGGAASLAGALSVFADPFLAAGSILPILQAGGIEGDFTAFRFNGDACGSGGADVWICPGPHGDTDVFTEEFLSGSLNLRLARIPLPEPTAWAMMLAGFGSLGVMMRVRRKTAVPA